MKYYSEEQARAIIVKAGHELLEKKLASRTWGNISARISPDRFIITPSGKAYEDIQEKDLVIVSVADCSYEGDVIPSTEKKVHAVAYALRDDICFVIHTHQFYASVVGAEGKDLPFAACAAYGMPGTDALRDCTAKVIRDNPEQKAFLMMRHGAVCLGTSCEDAFAEAEKLEEKCKEAFESRAGKLDETEAHAEFNADFLAEDYPYCTPKAKQTPGIFSRKFSESGKTLQPYLDDFAQIAGINARCCPPKKFAVRCALHDRNAVLVKNCGAFCVAATADDLDAVQTITEKNCAAALYVREAAPLTLPDALRQRQLYLKKYSRLK